MLETNFEVYPKKKEKKKSESSQEKKLINFKTFASCFLKFLLKEKTTKKLIAL